MLIASLRGPSLKNLNNKLENLKITIRSNKRVESRILVWTVRGNHFSFALSKPVAREDWEKLTAEEKFELQWFIDCANSNLRMLGAADARELHYVRFLFSEDYYRQLSKVWLAAQAKHMNVSPVELMLNALRLGMEKIEADLEKRT